MPKGNRVIYNVESPPAIDSISVNELDLENVENMFYIWPILKDVIPNYIFTTKKNYKSYNKNDDITTINQLDNLTFCTKVNILHAQTSLKFKCY